MKRLLAVVVASLALAGVAAASSGPPPTGQIVLGMNHYCQTKGGNSGTQTIPTDCGKGEVAVVNADGSGLRVLTHDKVTEFDPVWSPNHEQIAFIKPTAHTSSQIWVMNADGTQQHSLTRLRRAPQLFSAEIEPALSWSPDGQQIVFSAFPNDQGGREQLYLLSVRTRSITRLPVQPGGATNPAWSPDGRWVAFVGAVAPDRIFLMSTRTHHVHALVSRAGAKVTGHGIAWSPDSTRLVFNAHGGLEMFNIRTRQFHRVFRDGDSPNWSPDGHWIVFCYGDYIREIRPNGTGQRHILYVSSNKGHNFSPDW